MAKTSMIVRETRRKYPTRVRNRCTRCGRIEDVPLDPPEELENTPQGVTDFTITGYRLEFVGFCPRCKRKETGSRKTSGIVRKET